MGANRAIEIENIAEFRRNLRKAGSDAKKTVREYDKKIATEVSRYVPEYATERTGRMKRSIRSGADNKGGFVSVGTGTRTPYVPVQHWGWPARNIPRQGFLIRGLARAGREHNGDLANYYLEGLMETLKELGETSSG